MSTTILVTVWLALALVAVNLPWLGERILFVFAPRTGSKPSWVRWAEWALMSVLAVGAGIATELKATGERHPQDWEFYAIALCLALVAALPGFVWRYQWRPLAARQRR